MLYFPNIEVTTMTSNETGIFMDTGYLITKSLPLLFIHKGYVLSVISKRLSVMLVIE